MAGGIINKCNQYKGIKMNKKLLLTGIFALFSLNVMADNQKALTIKAINIRNKEILSKAGLSVPEYNQINIVPANKYLGNIKMGVTQNANDAHMAKKMREYLSMNNEQQKNGYVKDTEPRAKELMELKRIAPYQKKRYKGVLSPTSTHLRASNNELKLAYTFVGVPTEEMNANIGVVPYGAYKSVKNGDNADGWDGAVQFFEKKGVGSCAYTEHNRKIAGTGVELIKELVTYDVNNKPTIVLVKGNKNTGFVYKLKWYDNIFSREIECANPEFNQQLRTEVIDLANRIDSYQQ
jgi:hypothetical protein